LASRPRNALRRDAEARLDPALWRGDTLEERLHRHFVDIRTTEAFKEFVAAKRVRDPTAKILCWRRRCNRRGHPVLEVVLRWRGRERRWQFPLLTTSEASEDGRRFLVFDALLPRTQVVGESRDWRTAQVEVAADGAMADRNPGDEGKASKGAELRLGQLADTTLPIKLVHSFTGFSVEQVRSVRRQR
jgi:hypothetical protein